VFGYVAAAASRRLRERPLDGFAGATLESFRANDAAEERDLHADGGEARHIVGSGHVLRVHQPVWAVEEGVHEFEGGCVVVHLFKEVLDVVGVVVELIGANALHILLVIPLLVEEEATKILGEDKRGIVP